MNRAGGLFFVTILTVIFVLSVGSSSLAQSKENISLKDMNSGNHNNAMAGITVGRFSVASDRFKEIFNNPSTVTGIEASYLFSSNNHFLGFSLEIRELSKSGHSTVTHQNAFFSLTPITLTGKYMISISDLSPYLGAGIDLFLYKEESHISRVSGLTTGIHLEGGAYYRPPLFEFIKIRAVIRISRAVVKDNIKRVNLGGLEFGLGFLYCFDV